MRGYSAIGLHQPKTAANVGSVLRAAHCYGAAMVATTGKRYTKAPTDPQNGYRHIPLLNVDDLKAIIPYNCVPVAVEFFSCSRSLITYTHPERAFYILGRRTEVWGNQCWSGAGILSIFPRSTA